MNNKMTGKELQDAIASGAIIMVKGRYVSTITEKIDYGPVNRLKSTSVPISLMPVKLNTNKRVKGANKIIIDDIKFDSRLEGYMYTLLKDKNINFEMQHVFILQPGFRNKSGKAIISIKWKADFYLPDHNLIIDTKGWSTEIFKIKYKIFQYLQSLGSFEYVKKVEFPKKRDECLVLSISLK